MLNEKSATGNAVVVGAGVMGAGIASLLANVGWRVSLLDRLPEDAGTDPKSRNRIAQEGLDRALKSRPAQFALPEYAKRVRVGNVEDNLDWLSDADWVVEAVAEDLQVKRSLFVRIAENVGPQTVVSSNTSGLSLAGMVSDCPQDFRARFLGTHFFNPPRYMKPLELIPQAETDPAIFEGFTRFADRFLGKRIIRAIDTPGFISTRLGMYSLAKAVELGIKYEFDQEFVDYLTGPLIGRPKTGTYRLADLIGLDITSNIVKNFARDLPEDSCFQEFVMPEVVSKLVADGKTGTKAGAGFYKRAGSEILSLDIATLEYRPQRSFNRFPPEVEKLPLAERLRALWDLSGQLEYEKGFLQELFRSTIGYIADVTPEVANRIVDVDDALMGGFGWELGPFHQLDVLSNVDWPAGVPSLVASRIAADQPRFYSNELGRHYFFDFKSGEMRDLPRSADLIILKDLKKAGKTVQDAGFASMVDLGDGVLCAEWHTKMNMLDPDVVNFLDRARERAEESFAALVLGGTGDHFSVGFNLALFVEKIESQDWEWIDQALIQLQQVYGRMKYSLVPIVAAVYGYTLGGGCEMILHTDSVCAAFESAIGLPEANVGLIPAGGGVTQMLLRTMESVPEGTLLEPADPFSELKAVWENLRAGRFSSSAPEASKLGFLSKDDRIIIHPDRLLDAAKEHVLSLAESYTAPNIKPVIVMAESGLARFHWDIHLLGRSRQITDHDALISEKLAWVLAGGSLRYRAEVSEQYLLGLEREAFLSLAGTPETRARIRHTLETGKPLRN